MGNTAATFVTDFRKWFVRNLVVATGKVDAERGQAL